MPNRTERRAAERKARKLERSQQAIKAPTGLAAVSVQSHQPTPQVNQEFARPSIFDTALADLAAPPTNVLKEATSAQIIANRANSQLSTGPRTPEGRAAVSQNRRSHGLAGTFQLLAHEDRSQFQLLADSIYAEHQPDSDSQQRLANAVIQHYWLMHRAIHLQHELLLHSEDPTQVDEKRLGLFLRYQSTHERSYYKAMRELQILKKQNAKEQIGFESQTRNQQALEARTRLTNARASTIEIDAAARQIMEAPLPGTTRISFEELTKACSSAIAALAYKNQFETAA